MSLADAGYRVFLLVADGLGDSHMKVEIVDAGSCPQSRIRRVLFSMTVMYKAARKINAQLYHFHDPELIPAGLLLKAAGKKVIYDAHEDLPRQQLSKKYANRFLLFLSAWVFELIEDFAATRYNAVVTATDTIGIRFSRFARKTVTVKNYPRLEEFSSLRTPSGIAKKKRACYVGGISLIRGFKELLSAAKLTKYPIEMAGIIETDSLRNEILDKDTLVIYRGILGRAEVAEFIAQSMVGLVTLLPEPNYICSLPTKMFEYMAAGVPVIASDFPLWKEIVVGGECGLCIDASDPSNIARAIDYLIENPKEGERMGMNGRRLIEERYSWSCESKRLISLYDELTCAK